MYKEITNTQERYLNNKLAIHDKFQHLSVDRTKNFGTNWGVTGWGIPIFQNLSINGAI